MRLRISFSVQKTDYFLRKYQRWFLIAVFLFLLALNFYFYYHYVYRTDKAELKTEGGEITINKETLQKIIGNLELRESNLKRVETSRYSDPFK